MGDILYISDRKPKVTPSDPAIEGQPAPEPPSDSPCASLDDLLRQAALAAVKPSEDVTTVPGEEFVNLPPDDYNAAAPVVLPTVVISQPVGKPGQRLSWLTRLFGGET